MLPIVAPFPIYNDLDGDPLDDGSIYYGVANANPVTSPVPIFWDLAGTQPAAQPIKVVSGYPVHFGTPANVYTSSVYSVSVYDKKGRLVDYAPDSSQYDRLAGYIGDLANQTDPAKGSSLVGYKLNTATSVGRTVNSKLSDFVSVKDFGAVGDGATVDTTAFTLAMAFANTIVVPAGQYRINTNMTVPTGKRLQFRDGASLTVDTGATVTFVGQVEAGVEQLFFGLGTVLGLRFVRPEWFGAKRTGAPTNDAPAFQKAQNCMEAGLTSDGSEMCMQLSSGVYGLGSGIVCTPNIASNITWRGQGGSGGTYLQGLAAWTGANGVIQLAANAVNSQGSSCLFQDFRIVPQTAGSGSTVGILIGGSATLVLQGGAQETCLFENVGVYDFPTCWQIIHVRSFQFRRCSGWVQTITGTCLQIAASVNGLFTGDLDFYSCQFTGNFNPSTVMSIGSTTSGAQVAGVRFHAQIMYSGGANITSTGGGVISDIWFTSGWQYDTLRGVGFSIGASGAGSQVYNLNFQDGYIAGGLVTSAAFINVFATASGKVQAIDISRNYFVQAWGDAVVLNTVNQVHINDNRFVDPNGGSLVNFIAGNNIQISGNTAMRKSLANSIAYQVTNGGGSNYYAIRNNLSNGITTTGTVNDAAPGAQKVVDGNF